MSGGTDIALAVKDLSAGYGGPAILKSVSLAVAKGRLVTVVGPNGHGKTTLLRTISSLTKPLGGTIEIGGRPTARLSPSAVAALGVAHVPQGDLLFPEMTVGENLMMGAYLEKSAATIRRRMDEVFALMPRLAERRGQIAASLSGGERRMAGIGRGLMSGADLMLIDEPSLGLAPLIIEQIYAVIGGLKASGRSILLVEENPVRVADIADEMHLIDDGVIVWSGPPSELLERDELLATYLGG